MNILTLMNLRKHLILSCTLFLCASHLHAQVSGTKTIGIDYPTLAAAVSDLNTVGTSGPVTINVPAGYTETAPAGGYVLGSTILNASTTATATLTFQKSGTGTDPLLTAPVGTSATTDGIFIIQGTDYVIIDGIDLAESAANTTATTQMEWGYALVKLQNTAPFDGCQNVTIQNCTVTLNITNAGSVGIYANNHIATATTALSITAATDAMNNCRFYSNSIQNCANGISLKGYASAASPYTLYDQGNDLGGVSFSTGNTISNYAGAAAGSGINLQYQNNANVSYNTVNNLSGGGVAATNTLYGVYVQNGTNASATVNNNTINITQGTTGSSMYGINASCAGTGTITINNNILTANGGSSGTAYMVYIGGGNTNINTNGNNFANINVATTGSLYMVYHSTAAATTNITCSNNFTSGSATPYVNKTGGGGTVACYYNNAGAGNGTVLFNNNNFSNFNLAGSPTFYGLFENDGGSGQNKFARNNTISNITSAGGTLYGLWMGFSAIETFANNSVTNLNAGAGSAYGVYVNSSSTADSVYNNSVNNLSSASANVYGIYISGGTTVNVFKDTVNTLAANSTSTGLAYGIYESGGTTVNIFQNKIYDIAAAGAGSSVNGMYLNSGTVTAYNNEIGDLRTPNLNTSTGTQLAGIYIGGGTADNIYYNSIYLNAASTGTNFGSCGIYSSTTPAVTLANNIVDNASAPTGTGLTVAYRRSSTTLTTYQAASNNNLFYAGTPGSSNVIYYDGTTTYPTLLSYKSLVSPRDGNSVTEAPPFVSTAGPSAAFLQLSTSTPTQVESGGLNIAGITTDYYGAVRAGNPGYAGSGSSPDIGAIEGNYMLTDLSAPNIIDTALSSGCSTGDRTFFATITDATGVPVTGTQVPRVYFRNGIGTWFSQPGSLVSGTGTNGVWSFTISTATLGGLSIGDAVSYFVIAQDAAATPNIGSNPSAGLAASDVNTVTAYPTTLNTYTIIPSLTGTYNVGTGMAYTTITAAIAAYNASCVSGPVIFQLTDASYAAETFPITINANGSASPANTLTIRPAAGVSPIISGNSGTAIFVINGADYVTIDGSNSPVTNSICPAISSSRNITIANSSTSTSSAVIWLQTSATGDGATNNTVRNCNVTGSGSSNTLFGVGMGGTAIAYSSLGAGNNGNRIENDSISAVQTGIFSMGASAANKNNSNVINQNLLNSPTPGNLRNNGILVGFENEISISGNKIANITNGVSNDIIGISVGIGNNAAGTSVTTGNEVTNASITNNQLDNITQTNTYTALGIAVAGASSGINTIANNMISGVLSNGTGGDFSSGIFIGGATGGATNIFYNSVSMSGTTTGASYPTFAISISGTNPVVNVKNNVFVNNASTGSSLLYAIGLAYTGYSNLSSDHNDFYSAGANLATVGALSGFGTDEATLPDWQTETGNDANSKNVNPAFVSSSDLHLTAVSANVPLDNTGTPVSVTTDYDCSPRSTTTPDMGINEFDLPVCSSVTAGIAAPDTTTFCASGSTTIHLTGATVALGITYQWQSSADSVSWSIIPGATNDNYTTPVLTSTSFYRLVLRCTSSGLTDSTGTSVTIHPLPLVTVSPDGGAICSGGTGLSMTAAGAATYSWTPSAGLSSTSGASVIANPLATTAYTVTGTDLNGCNNSHVSTISVTTAPGAITISPSPVTLCAGGPAALLSAGGAALPSSGPDTFATGAISVTVPDATPGGAAVPVSVTGIPGGATITSVSVLFDVTMTFDGDLTINLSAPNGNTLNLVNREGGGGEDFTGTTVTSAGGLSFSSSSAPYSDIFAADAGTGTGTTGLPQTTIVWTDLYSLANGTWTLSARDWAGGDVASITSYTLVINYTYNPAVTWAPVSGLFTDAAGTTPYTGGSAATVYAAPVATTGYTATLSLGACSSTATDSVHVNPLPVTGPISGPAIVCTGSSITLSDTSAGGTWSSSNSSATVSSSGSVTGVTAGMDTIAYTLTNSCGPSSATKIITVSTSSSAGIISGASSICVGASTIFVDALTGGTWSISNTAAAISSSGLVTALHAGIDTIRYTVTNTCGTAVATKLITINPLADSGVISGPASVCIGSSINLAETVPGGTWSSSSADATISATGVVSGLSTGTVTINYTVTNTCGTATASYNINVYPVPSAFTVTGGGTYCAGGVGVHVGVSGSESGVSYQLYRDGAPLGAPVAGTGSSIDLGLETLAGDYTVQGAYATGCATNMTGSAAVIINPTTPPSVSITTSGMGDTLCAGTAATFTAIPMNGGLSPTYQWKVNGITTATGSTYSYTPAAGDVVAVTITSSTCAVPDTASHSITITIVPYLAPSVSISATPGSTVCSGSPVTFSAVAVNGGSAPLFAWTKNGINVATGPTYTFTPANGDVVYCTLTSSYPCTLHDTATSNTIAMTVTPSMPPSVTITAHPGTSIAIGQADTLFADVTNGGPAPTYEWLVNGVAIPGATNSFYIHAFSNGDDVTVIVTSSGVCGGATAHNHVIILVGELGVGQVTANEADVRLLPNPNNGTFALKGNIGVTEDEEVTILITDMLGQQVYRKKVTTLKGNINEPITLNGSLANGMYMLTLHTDTGNTVFHFVLEQ